MDISCKKLSILELCKEYWFYFYLLSEMVGVSLILQKREGDRRNDDQKRPVISDVWFKMSKDWFFRPHHRTQHLIYSRRACSDFSGNQCKSLVLCQACTAHLMGHRIIRHWGPRAMSCWRQCVQDRVKLHEGWKCAFSPHSPLLLPLTALVFRRFMPLYVMADETKSTKKQGTLLYN